MTKKTSNVISLKKIKMKKKYGKIFEKNKYLFIIIAIPILIASFMIMDKWIIKNKFSSENLEQIPYSKNYVLNERQVWNYKELKVYSTI
ncbi:MAG: hypothetical protein ACRC3Y_13535 [Romboutsia sp.]|uniref:hypothetical protein n=1 Tax=Romboutsia sp. TaxID=1965302 RepID=UPI003F3B0794